MVAEFDRPYPNAPISEAIIQVSVGPDVEVERLEGLFAEVGDVETAFNIASEVKVEDGQLIGGETSTVLNGYIFRNEHVRVGALRNAFYTSQAAKYTDWADFLAKVEPLWDRYREQAQPQRVTGLGVRFINQIVIPHGCVEFSDYVRTTVNISPYLPQSVSELFMRVGIPLAEWNAMAFVTSAMLPQPEPGHGAVLLDIDVTQAVDLDPASEDFSSTLLGRLETLRDAKNYVFEACITDATRGLIG